MYKKSGKTKAKQYLNCWSGEVQTLFHNAIKDPQWYAVQGSDTTMMPIAASLPGQ